MPSENNRRRKPAPQKVQEPQSSPFAGCLIMAIGAFVMIFLVAFTFWSLSKMDRALGTFTEKEARPTLVLDPVNHEAEFNDLSRRLDGFSAAIQANTAAEIQLTALDLNLAIAAHEQFKNLRSTFTVQEITDKDMIVQISYPMRGHPFGDGTGRFLNGTLHGKPELESGQVLLELTEIDSVKGDVPPEFVGHLSDHQITAPFLEDEKMGPILKKLTTVSLTDGALVASFDPATAPPGRQPITMAEIDRTRQIAITCFAVTGTLFVVFLLVFLRKKKGQQPKGKKTSH